MGLKPVSAKASELKSHGSGKKRLKVAQESPGLIFGRGAHESSAQFKTRLKFAAKISKPIMPRSDGEGETKFEERCKLQVRCDYTIHAYDGEREDAGWFGRRRYHRQRRLR